MKFLEIFSKERNNSGFKDIKIQIYVLMNNTLLNNILPSEIASLYNSDVTK